MVNLNLISNLNEITRPEFDTLVKAESFDILTQSNLKNFLTDLGQDIEKAEEEVALEAAKDIVKSELGGFEEVLVRENDLSLSKFYMRKKAE